MTQILCPYCFTKHGFHKSLECPNVESEQIESDTAPIDSGTKHEKIPARFKEDYEKAPPLWLVTVGFQQHGKTCYQAALTVMIENLSRVWPNSTSRYLDPRTNKAINDARMQVFSGIMPKSTKPKVPRPLFISTYGLPKFGSNCLVLYDTAGELYQELKETNETEPWRPLIAAKNIWFLVSLRHLKSSESQKTIHDLLTVYLDSMEKMGSPLKGRNLIVVYTQADAIIDDFDYGFSETIIQYVRNDPFQNLSNYNFKIPEIERFTKPDFLDKYISEMEHISEELKIFTKRLHGGNAFIKLVEMHEMGLYFSIVSALGKDPDPMRRQVMSEDEPRFRVLDPYFWSLYLNEPDEQCDIFLLLDGAQDSSLLYKFDLHQFARFIQDKGDVTTYIMGQKRKDSVVDQAPRGTPPSFPRPRLIGPLLESGGKATKFIIMTTGKIHDFEEFTSPDWYHRILLISVGKDDLHAWPNLLSLREGDDISVLLDEVSRFLSTPEKSGG